MPGVLLIEAAAQAAGALWASTRTDDGANRFVLAQVVQFKIVQPARPGETVLSEVTLDHLLGSLAQFSVVQSVGEKEIARGRLVLSEAGSRGAPRTGPHKEPSS